jgi:hypothetical protein
MAGGVSVGDFDLLIQSLRRVVKARGEFMAVAQDFCARLCPADFKQPGMSARLSDITAVVEEAKRQDVEFASVAVRCGRMLSMRTVN